MAWEPDLIEDGAEANALSLNSILIDAVSWINAIGRAGPRRGTFNHAHAGSVITTPDTTWMTVRGDDGIQIYSFTVFTTSLVYSVYGNPGGTDAAGNLGSGDRVLVGHESQTGAYGGPEAVLTLPDAGLLVGMANGDRCAGILILFNIQIRFAQFDETDLDQHELMFCIQVQFNATGLWRTIPQSESFMSIEDHMLNGNDLTEDIQLDCPITTFLDEDTVNDLGTGTSATDHVTGIRAMFSVVEAKAGTIVRFERFNLSAIPVHAQDP